MDMPDVKDCLDLVESVQAISEMQQNEPISWSRRPRAGMRSRALPYPLADLFVSRICQLTIDIADESNENTFPIGVIANVAMEIIEDYMLGEEAETPTTSAEIAGSRRFIFVIVEKRVPWQLVSDGVTQMSNQTWGENTLGGV